jgi:hypothetical protein
LWDWTVAWYSSTRSLPTIAGLCLSCRPFHFFGGQHWGWNSGPHLLGTLTVQPMCLPCFYIGCFRDRVSVNYLPGLASNCDPPDLCLLSSWDYRHFFVCPFSSCEYA